MIFEEIFIDFIYFKVASFYFYLDKSTAQNKEKSLNNSWKTKSSTKFNLKFQIKYYKVKTVYTKSRIVIRKIKEIGKYIHIKNFSIVDSVNIG